MSDTVLWVPVLGDQVMLNGELASMEVGSGSIVNGFCATAATTKAKMDADEKRMVDGINN
jgi:hypothetical protein